MRFDWLIRLIRRGLIAAADVGILPWCWERTALIPFWNCVIGGELEELDDGRVVENVRVAAAGVDIAVIPREARAKGGLIWVARACALFRLLGVQDKLSGTLLCPGCRAAFVSGVPDGWVRRMP